MDGHPPIRVGISAGMHDVRQTMQWAELAESCGFDLLGYGDTQCLLPELDVALAAMATVTERVLLCSTVTNPVTRHTAVAASAFATLQQLSGGRIRYCVGSGDSAVGLVGAAAAGLGGLEAHSRAFRALVSGEEADLGGRRFRLDWPAPPVPLWLAAGGPRTLELAGRLADGVLVGTGLTEDVVADSLARIHHGARDAGRDPAAIEVWWFAKVFVCDDEQRAWRDLAWTLAATANHAFRGGFADKCVPSSMEEPLQRLRAGYASRAHNGIAQSPEANTALVVDNGLTEFLGRRFLIAGPPEEVAGRLEQLAGWGATNLLVPALFGDPVEFTATVAGSVLPLLGR